jgi:hypothetical protein
MSARAYPWFRFSLRTLFVVVTLLCVWLGYQVNWIRQRRAFLASHDYFASGCDGNRKSLPPLQCSRAPWSLRLLGENGVEEIYLPSPEEQEQARRLFPEAQNIWYAP